MAVLLPGDFQGQYRDLPAADRKSTRLNSSHSQISYAVFCLKKKTNDHYIKLCTTLHYKIYSQHNTLSAILVNHMLVCAYNTDQTVEIHVCQLFLIYSV